MTHLLRFVATLIRWLRRSQAEREAEIIYLRQQLIVLKRAAPTRPRLKTIDRVIFVCLYRLFPSLIDASVLFKPETLLRWHRTGFRLFWRWKSRRRGRPPCPIGRHTRSRSTDQSREPSLGCTTHPRRTAQARHRDRPVDGRLSTWCNDVGRRHKAGMPFSAITPRISPPSICLSCRPSASGCFTDWSSSALGDADWSG